MQFLLHLKKLRAVSLSASVLSSDLNLGLDGNTSAIASCCAVSLPEAWSSTTLKQLNLAGSIDCRPLLRSKQQPQAAVVSSSTSITDIVCGDPKQQQPDKSSTTGSVADCYLERQFRAPVKSGKFHQVNKIRIPFFPHNIVDMLPPPFPNLEDVQILQPPQGNKYV